MGALNIQRVKLGDYTFMINSKSIDFSQSIGGVLENIKDNYLHQVVDFTGGPGYVYNVGPFGNLWVYTYKGQNLSMSMGDVEVINPDHLTEKDRETFALFIMKR